MIKRLLITILISSLFITSNSYAQEQVEEDNIDIEDIQRFSAAINQIKSYYVKPIDNTELFENAIRGMLDGLDPHSAYLDKEEFKDLQATTQGEFGGVGLEITRENGIIKVITPLDETPAQTVGIKAGDYIVRIGQSTVEKMTLREAVTKMRGKKGSKVKLTIVRDKVAKPLQFTLVRDIIKIKSIKSDMLDKGFGYIRISHFQTLTAKDLIKAVKKLKKRSGGKLKGLVLDLRNNPGGLLDSAIQISDAFIHNDKKGNEEMIVYTKGRIPGASFTALASPGDILNDAPIVVLINEGSASGSEIVAGALKDNKRAILVGTQSFGKGSVQTVIPLDAHHGIKLTTALYYTPSGNSIQATGITPDIIIENLQVQDQEKSIFDNLQEADLAGHLEDNSQKNKANSDKKLPTSPLTTEDYQLYQALNVLKGLALAQ